jgi:TolB-like protein
VANILTAQETKGKPTIVVIPYDAKNIEQSDAEVLLETFTNKIADSGKFKVVDRSKVNEIKKQHEFQNSDWSNDEKVAKLGNALNANMVAVGKLMPFQKKINASFRILDVNTMEIVSTADGVFDDILAFFNKIPEIVKKLTGEIKSISTTSNITSSKPESSSVSTNVSTPTPKSTSSSKTTTTYGYNIGDTGPGGGIIYHTSGSYIYEVSPILGKYDWNTAKRIANTYRGGGYNDWYLPTKYEIDLLCQSLRKIGKIQDNNWYWSSTERDDRDAWGQAISYGCPSWSYKIGTHSVRAIRRFYK